MVRPCEFVGKSYSIPTIWRGGRVVEGAALEMLFTAM